jgi:DNA-binding NtrC family response regulator
VVVGELVLDLVGQPAAPEGAPRPDTSLDGRLAAVHETLLCAGSGPARRIEVTGLGWDERSPMREAVARLATQLGFVAVRSSELPRWPDLSKVLSGRSVVALQDGADAAPLWALAHAALSGARIAAVVRLGAPACNAPALAREAATGAPLPDPSLLATDDTPRLRPGGRAPAAFIPGSTRFGIACGEAEAADPVSVRLAQRLDRAARLLDRQRVAAARRDLRAVVELGDGRPADAALAARAGAALAGQWLDEAQPALAAREARRAAANAVRARDARALVVSGLLLGHALLDLARPDEAERVACALLESVRDVGGALAAAAAAAAARCLLWRGQADRAWQLLNQPIGPLPRYGLAPLLRWRARVAIARGELAEAGRLVGRCAEQPGHAAATASLVLLSADLARRTGRVDLAAAMLADRWPRGRAPAPCALAVKVACLRLHVAAAAGDTAEALRLSAAAARLRRGLTAPLLAARLDLALEAAGGRRATQARALVTTGGLTALLDTQTGGSVVLDAVLEVLRVCHETGGNLDALTQVCEVLRARLDAVSVRVTTGVAGRPLAAAGGPSAPSMPLVERVMVTGRLAEPGRAAEGIEAAVPVRCGGDVLAVIACRWTADAVVDSARAGALLTAAGAAAGPLVQDALDRDRTPAPTPGDDLGLVGTSPVMERLRDAVRRAAPVGFPVLITGESGSGKELVARAIHRLGARRQRRCSAVNCAALTDELLEAELFGHARGAFTGAVSERPGLFEEADGGTLFLDEVGELSARAQAKLLRVLQEGEVRRVGETLPRRVDVRVIGATNRAIEHEVELGRFRADLRYRLDVLRVAVPPLRDRPEDIPLLAARFWDECAARAGSQARLEPRTVDALVAYHWPGNVRELQNVMATLAVEAPRRGRVGPHLLPRRLDPSPPDLPGTLDEARRRFDAAFVRDALQRTGGRRGETARQLGLSRQGLIKLMVRLGLESDPLPGGGRSGRRGGAVA